MMMTIEELKKIAEKNKFATFENDKTLLFIDSFDIFYGERIVMDKKDPAKLEYNLSFFDDRDSNMLAAVEEYIDSFESEREE